MESTDHQRLCKMQMGFQKIKIFSLTPALLTPPLAPQVSVYNFNTATRVRTLSFAYLSKQPVVAMDFSRDNKYLVAVTQASQMPSLSVVSSAMPTAHPCCPSSPSDTLKQLKCAIWPQKPLYTKQYIPWPYQLAHRIAGSPSHGVIRQIC